MATVGTVYVSVQPSMDGFSAAVNSAVGRTNMTAGSRAMGSSLVRGLNLNAVGTRVGRTITTGITRALGVGRIAIGSALGTALTAGITSVTSHIDSAISRTDTINNYPKIMQSLGFGAEESQASIDSLVASIDGLPTSLDGIIGAVQKIAPLTSSLSDATDISIALNNALLAGGKSSDLQANALEQYSQMYALGKVDMAAWRSMASAMPGQLNQLAQSLLGAGAGAMDLYNAMGGNHNDVTVTFDDFNNALLRLNSEGLEGFQSFSEQARVATGGIGTAMENVGNRVNKAIEKVINNIGAEGIASKINEFSSGFNGAADVVNAFIDSFRADMDLGNLERIDAALQPIRDALATVDASELAKSLGEIASDAIATGVEKVSGFVSQIITSAERYHLVDHIKQSFSDIANIISGIDGSPFVEFIIGGTTGFYDAMEPVREWLNNDLLASDQNTLVEQIRGINNGAAFGWLNPYYANHVDPAQIMAQMMLNAGRDTDEVLTDVAIARAQSGKNFASFIAGSSYDVDELLANVNRLNELDIDPKQVNISADGLVSTSDGVVTLAEYVNNLPDGTTTITDGQTANRVSGDIVELSRNINNIPTDTTVNVSASALTDETKGKVAGILANLKSIRDGNWVSNVKSTVTQTVETVKAGPAVGKSAEGGRVIRPYLTWVGEGGSDENIIPNNRAGVAPLASLLVEQMGGIGGTTIYIGDVRVDDGTPFGEQLAAWARAHAH